MKSENNITKLSIWKLNAKKWRIDNGFVSPEWEQYVKWSQLRHIVSLTFGYGVGIIVGILFVIL